MMLLRSVTSRMRRCRSALSCNQGHASRRVGPLPKFVIPQILARQRPITNRIAVFPSPSFGRRFRVLKWLGSSEVRAELALWQESDEGENSLLVPPRANSAIPIDSHAARG